MVQGPWESPAPGLSKQSCELGIEVPKVVGQDPGKDSADQRGDPTDRLHPGPNNGPYG